MRRRAGSGKGRLLQLSRRLRRTCFLLVSLPLLLWLSLKAFETLSRESPGEELPAGVPPKGPGESKEVVVRKGTKMQQPAHHFVRTHAGVDMPRLIYGTAWKKEQTTQLVLTALKLGFRGVDTACQPKHYREDLVGVAVRQALEERVVERSQLFLQTKFTSLDGQDPNNIPYDKQAPLEEQVQQSFAKSLSNLGVDYLDSVVLHSPLRTYNQTLTAWRVLEGFHAQGKVRQLGMSNTYDLSLLQRLFLDAQVKPAVLQNRFYRQTGYDKQLRAFCREHGIVYQSFWTLTANPDILESRPIASVASRLQCTLEQAFFRFVMQLGVVPLTGTRNTVHMQQDLAVLDLPELSEAEFGAVAEMVGGL